MLVSTWGGTALTQGCFRCSPGFHFLFPFLYYFRRCVQASLAGSFLLPGFTSRYVYIYFVFTNMSNIILPFIWLIVRPNACLPLPSLYQMLRGILLAPHSSSYNPTIHLTLTATLTMTLSHSNSGASRRVSKDPKASTM